MTDCSLICGYRMPRRSLGAATTCQEDRYTNNRQPAEGKTISLYPTSLETVIHYPTSLETVVRYPTSFFT